MASRIPSVFKAIRSTSIELVSQEHESLPRPFVEHDLEVTERIGGLVALLSNGT